MERWSEARVERAAHGTAAPARGRRRWLRLAARAAFLLIGALQSLFGVMLGVGLLASVFFNGEGPGGGAALVALDLVLIAPGVLALFSALEEWDPPDDRWHGLRWPVLGALGSGISLFCWLVASLLVWSPLAAG